MIDPLAPAERPEESVGAPADLQAHVMTLLVELVAASGDEAAAATRRALDRLGELGGFDRITWCSLDPDARLLQSIHAWCASGIGADQPLPPFPGAALFPGWRPLLAAGSELCIPDTAAPPQSPPDAAMLSRQGIKSLLVLPLASGTELRGLICFEMLRRPRSFPADELGALRAMAEAIAAVESRREAAVQRAAAHRESKKQHARLQAILAAVPDLVIELDGAGCFVAAHSASMMTPEKLTAEFAGRPLEEIVPAGLAQEARRVVAELDGGAATVSRCFRARLLTDNEAFWQLSASKIGKHGYLMVLRDVTATHQQTREFQRLSEVARRTTNLVAVTDARGCIDWVNKAFEQTTGWRLEEVRGRPLGPVLQSEPSDPATLALIADAIAAGNPLQVELRNRTRHAGQCWLAVSLQPIRDAAGAVEGFMAVATDVTERRHDADALRRAADEAAQAHAALEAALNALQDGFALFDADDRLVIFNQKYRDIYFRSAPAIVEGATFESILKVGLEKGKYADAIGREAEWLAERMARHHAAAEEFEQQLSDGRWLRIFEKATRDGGCVSLSIDITALKTSEQRALADRWSAMDASQDGIAITDPQGRFQYMNRSHLALYGFSDEAEVIGLHWSILYGPVEAAWIRTHALPALRERGRWSGEIMGRSKDGKPVDIDVSLTLKRDGGIVAIVRDMTERRIEASERERIRQELHLAQKREVVGQLAAGLAHDFNNLLAAIEGSASLILTDASPGSLTATNAARIEAASFQGRGLVKRLLTLGARQPERRLLDLRAPLQEAAALLRASLNKSSELTVAVPESPVQVMADPSDILQVVLNLVINASHALEGEAGQITVTLAEAEAADLEGGLQVGALDAAQRYVALSVSDTGCGMSADLISQIFTSYFSTKGEAGTGLGLPIVASVVADNGGAIRVTSEPGRGTRFVILWPVNGPRPLPAPMLPPGLTGRLDGLKILAADDQQEVLDVVVALLEAAGAEVAPSTEPADILAAVESDPAAWDLVVTDLDMPGIGGEELAHAVRAIAPCLPVILITARAGITCWTRPVFDAVLEKPLDRENLILAVEAATMPGRERAD